MCEKSEVQILCHYLQKKKVGGGERKRERESERESLYTMSYLYKQT